MVAKAFCERHSLRLTADVINMKLKNCQCSQETQPWKSHKTSYRAKQKGEPMSRICNTHSVCTVYEDIMWTNGDQGTAWIKKKSEAKLCRPQSREKEKTHCQHHIPRGVESWPLTPVCPPFPLTRVLISDFRIWTGRGRGSTRQVKCQIYKVHG